MWNAEISRSFPKVLSSLLFFFVFNFLLLSLPQYFPETIYEELYLQGEAFCFSDFALQDILWINNLHKRVCMHIYEVISCLLLQLKWRTYWTSEGNASLKYKLRIDVVEALSCRKQVTKSTMQQNMPCLLYHCEIKLVNPWVTGKITSQND